jgi:Skp family chaperone for outer membrane proteins
MNMKVYTTLFLLPLIAAISSPAIAHYEHDGYSKFDQRIERQQQRIKQGVRTGELTKKEIKKLRKQQRHIKKLNRQFEKDGHLSHYERKTLKRKLNLASKRIYRLKHNDRYRRYDRAKYSGKTHPHYGHEHSTTPQLSRYALSDSSIDRLKRK